MRPLLSIPAVLGPKGYIIRLSGTDLTVLGLLGVPSIFRITDLPLDLSYLDIPYQQIAAGDQEAVTDSGIEEPLSGASARQAQATALAAGTCSLAYTSWNDFSFWNGSRQANNNCYCYGANYATNNWSLPGRKGGSPLPTNVDYSAKPSATRFHDAMIADGWKTTCNGSSLRVVGLLGKITFPGGYVAWDFHFMRKNLNGSTARWCQKGGQGPATNKDYSGNYITAPSTADRAKTFSNGVTYNYNEIIDTYFTPAGVRSMAIS